MKKKSTKKTNQETDQHTDSCIPNPDKVLEGINILRLSGRRPYEQCSYLYVDKIHSSLLLLNNDI